MKRRNAHNPKGKHGVALPYQRTVASHPGGRIQPQTTAILRPLAMHSELIFCIFSGHYKRDGHGERSTHPKRILIKAYNY